MSQQLQAQQSAGKLGGEVRLSGDRRDATIMAILAAARGRHLKLKAMDARWATGCRHAVLAGTDQLLPAERA